MVERAGGATTAERAGGATAAERAGAARLGEALREALRRGEWAVGERLPTERALGQRHGLARNTVRRALDALRAEGLITRHVGRGTFRAEPGRAEPDRTEPGRAGPDGMPEATPEGPHDDEAGSLSPSEVLECRLMLEPEMIALAVARATAGDIARMEACLRGGEAAAGLAEFERWDAALHDAFALGTRNGAVIGMSRSLARVRQRTDWGRLKARGNTAERRAALCAQHRDLVRAVRQRDPPAARRAMREHILFVQDYMFGD